jgi:hypothetical protein
MNIKLNRRRLLKGVGIVSIDARPYAFDHGEIRQPMKQRSQLFLLILLKDRLQPNLIVV